jgi:hypothetical protein
MAGPVAGGAARDTRVKPNCCCCCDCCSANGEKREEEEWEREKTQSPIKKRRRNQNQMERMWREREKIIDGCDDGFRYNHVPTTSNHRSPFISSGQNKTLISWKDFCWGRKIKEGKAFFGGTFKK